MKGALNAGNLLLAEKLLDSENYIYSMKLVILFFSPP